MSEFIRLIPVHRLGPQGDVVTVEARPEELAALTQRMAIPAINMLRCTFQLRQGEGAMIEASGVLDAVVTQVCVLSLDEFSHVVRERFHLRFVPAGAETDDSDPDSLDEIPYQGSSIDFGEAAAEQLGLALDPYPRKPDARGLADEGLSGAGPFAALAAMRMKQ